MIVVLLFQTGLFVIIMVNPSILVGYEWLFQLSVIAYFFLIIAILVMYVIWMYKVHKDIHDLNAYYPVSASMSLLLLIIPIVNLFGIGRIHNQIAKFYHRQSSTAHLHKPIVIHLIFWYILILMMHQVTRYIDGNPVTFDMYIFQNIGYLVVNVLILRGYKFINTGLITLFHIVSKEGKQVIKKNEGLS
jgi:heme/copper-type cytochrome/quinol oxidase subunit 2